MSWSDPAARPTPSAALVVTVFLGVCTSLLPLLRVVEPGGWVGGVAGIAILVLAGGYVARRLRAPAYGVALVEVGLWTVAMTALFSGGTAILGVIPSLETVRMVPVSVVAALGQIRDGAAPLDVGQPLAMMIVGAAGLLVIAMDHVAVTARMPMLAIVGLVAVYLIPSIAVPSAIDPLSFAAFAGSALALLAVETATRERSRVPGRAVSGASERPRGSAAAPSAIATVAILAALVVTPALPAPTGAGSTVVAVRGNSIDPSLELGQDLRRPQEVDVLTLRSDAPAPPYLRAVTLSTFDGAHWEADRGSRRPLDQGLQPVTTRTDVEVDEYTATIDILNFVSPWLPVPGAATEVEGLDGEWSVYDYNRTVISRSSSPQGQDYEVTYEVPRPTLEQIRGSEASIEGSRRTLALPGDDDLVAQVRQLAIEVAGDAGNDYDTLVALQRWFRGTSFEYSLSAPVADGFDGSGLEAVTDFLEERSGYCVHFASAFTIMARSLEMPARIVVGYLPGAASDERVDDQTVHTVVSSQLHAWPEVHFEGIGWVPFEPTNSLGVPTGFAAASTSGGPAGTDTGPLPENAPQEGEAPDAQDPGALDETTAPDAAATRVNTTPVVGLVAAIAALLIAPALFRVIRRRSRLRAAAEGDAAAAWAEVSDSATDLGVRPGTGETPRAFGMRLRDAGAPEEPVSRIVAAIERASYAAGGPAEAEDLAAAVEEIRAALRESGDSRGRFAATFAPASLFTASPRARGAGRSAG